MNSLYCIVTPRGESLHWTRAPTPEAAWQEFARGEDAPLSKALAKEAGYSVATYTPLANEKGA